MAKAPEVGGYVKIKGQSKTGQVKANSYVKQEAQVDFGGGVIRWMKWSNLEPS